MNRITQAYRPIYDGLGEPPKTLSAERGNMEEDSLNFILGEDGKFHKIDNTYDVLVQCENESDQEKLLEILEKYWK